MIVIDEHGIRVHHSCYAQVYGGAEREPLELYSEVRPGLFLGGTADQDWLADAAPAAEGAAPGLDVDAVVTLFPLAQPWPGEPEELRCEYAAADLHRPAVLDILDIAGWAYERWIAGRRVLIRCQDGLNKSALIAALVDMMGSHTAEVAIARIRAVRAPVALSNDAFVDWLLLHAIVPGDTSLMGADEGECTGLPGGPGGVPPF